MLKFSTQWPFRSQKAGEPAPFPTWRWVRFCVFGRVIISLIILSFNNSFARIITVAQDGTGDHEHIWEAVNHDAISGDTVLIMNGFYEFEPTLWVDSAVTLMAANPGGVQMLADPGLGFRMGAYSEMKGILIFGDDTSPNQTLVLIQEPGITLYNCAFVALARQGYALNMPTADSSRTVLQCNFDVQSGSLAMRLQGRNDFWMPSNYFGTTDTNIVDIFIEDGEIDDSTRGHVFISPVLDHFQWLALSRERPQSSSDHSVFAYPNPTVGTFTLNLPYHLSGAKIVMYDILGRKVWSSKELPVSPRVSMTAIDVGRELPTGIYFLSVTQKAELFHSRIIITR